METFDNQPYDSYPTPVPLARSSYPGYPLNDRWKRALNSDCPRCGAEPGEPCTSDGRAIKDIRTERAMSDEEF